MIDIDALEEAIGFEVIRQKGDEDIGYCPLPNGMHNNGDTTGKFSINREKLIYNCWVCGGGSIVKLAMEVNDSSRGEAEEWLKQFGMKFGKSEDAFVKQIAKVFSEGQKTDLRDLQANVALPQFNERVLEKWLTGSHPWLEGRGIKSEIATRFKLGFDPVHMYHDYNGPAIILPHFFDGRLVGYQSRWLEDDRPKEIPKYTNTRDFPKRTTLWGYDNAAENEGTVVVVESVPTALFLIGLGYDALATFGAMVTDEQVKLLRRFQRGVVLAPDNDHAGISQFGLLASKLDKFIPVRLTHAPLDAGEKGDLGDLSRDPDLVRKYIEEAKWHFANINR